MTSFWKNFTNVGLILVLGYFIFFPRLDSLPYRGEEPRRVVSSFEMQQSGNWIVPTIQNSVFLSRPPLQNWIIAMTGNIRGSFDHLTGRLPSALCALLTALLIYYYCLSCLSMETALLAALCFLTLPQVIQLGRTAETELLFTFLLSGSFLLWHRGELKNWPNGLKWGIAYLFLAGATLAKGINQAPLYFGAIIGLYLLMDRRIQELFSWAHLSGLALFCTLVGVWQAGFIHYVGSKTGWLMHAGDVGLRFQHFGLKDYLAHWFTFPLELLVATLPWSILLLAYCHREFRQKCITSTAKPILIFCLSALAITFFSVWFPPGAKTRYYMPLYPCLSILAALVLNSALVPSTGLSLTTWRWSQLGPVFAKIGMLLTPLVGCLYFLWAYFDIRFLLQTGSLNHAWLFLLGTLLLGLGYYWVQGLEPKYRVYLPMLIYSLFTALAVDLVYTDSRLKQYNNTEVQVLASLKQIPKDYPLVSIGPVSFDFLYYYMLHTGKTIPIVSYNNFFNHSSEKGAYFCAHHSVPLPLFSEKISTIVTGRFKRKYSSIPVEKTFIVKYVG